MNPLTLLFLVAAAVAFAESQVISSCPDDMNGVDLVFAMDASSSVGLKRYQAGVSFVKSVVLPFKGHFGGTDAKADQTRMALYEFDETQYTMFEFNTFQNTDDLVKYLDNFLMNKDQNGTDNFFVDAIDYARTKLFNKARAGAKKVLVFVADGWTDEDGDKMAAASKRATDENIDIFFVGYELDISEKTASIVVGSGHQDRVFIIKTFKDVADLTGCPTIETMYKCTHGIGTCENCPAPFYGPQCELRVNCTHKPPIVNDGKLDHIHMCHDHGVCYDEETGPVCVCEKCWTGQWCTELNEKECDMSKRCILYDTETTKKNQSLVQNVCDLTKERCISDNIDCGFNVHTHIDKNTGRPVCDPPGKREKCLCQYPIGYCIPLEIANNMFKSLAPKGAYIDKFFLGSS